jgi:hypothetical protein
VLNKGIRARKCDVKEILLLSVEHAVQLSEDVLIAPFLLADNFNFDLDWINKIKIVNPDHQILEKDAEFAIPLDASARMYILTVLNAQKDEIPIGSQILIESF